MNMRKRMVATVVSLFAFSPCVSQATTEYLSEEPSNHTLRHGQIVYVDDGKCPRGEVKEITAGNPKKGISRKVRCVKRPD